MGNDVRVLSYINPVIILTVAIFLILYLSADYGGKEYRTKQDFSRVISLSPAITGQISELGSENILVGVTSFHPPLKKKVEIIGSLINPNIEKIVSLKPDMVFLSMEDNPTQHTERLSVTGIRTHIFKRNISFQEICENFIELANLLRKDDAARKKLEEYRLELKNIKKANTRCRIAMFVSHDPLITASGNSFVGNIIEDAGGTNIMRDMNIPYPIISVEFIVRLNPDIIISIMEGSEKFFKNLLNGFANINAVKEGYIYTIDPELIALYTPGNYIASVKLISGIIKKWETKKHEE